MRCWLLGHAPLRRLVEERKDPAPGRGFAAFTDNSAASAAGSPRRFRRASSASQRPLQCQGPSHLRILRSTRSSTSESGLQLTYTIRDLTTRRKEVTLADGSENAIKRGQASRPTSKQQQDKKTWPRHIHTYTHVHACACICICTYIQASRQTGRQTSIHEYVRTHAYLM